MGVRREQVREPSRPSTRVVVRVTVSMPIPMSVLVMVGVVVLAWVRVVVSMLIVGFNGARGALIVRVAGHSVSLLPRTVV